VSVWQEYTVTDRLAPGLVRILRTDRGSGDAALWSKVKSRKPCKDAATGFPLPAGSSVYRPVGNQMYRYERLEASAVDSSLPGMTIA
jgi:hypothetical protein